MRITSVGIINNLSTKNIKIINMLDFDSKKLSIVEIKVILKNMMINMI